MNRFRYRHAAVFAHEVAAQNVLDRIERAQVGALRSYLIRPGDRNALQIRRAEGDQGLEQIITRALSGGGGAALGAALFNLAGNSLRIAAFAGHPLIALLSTAGYAGLLGSAGSVMFSDIHPDHFAQALNQAHAGGHWILVVHSADEHTDRQVSLILQQPFTEAVYESH